MSEPGATDPTSAGNRANYFWWRTTGGPLLVIVALVAVLAMCEDSGGGSADEVSPYEAEKQCERFIDDRIKSPASAEYELSTTGGPYSFTSTGTVDSQNSFGAMIRNEVTCSITLSGDTWRLTSLSGLTN